jgi:cytochrome c556
MKLALPATALVLALTTAVAIAATKEEEAIKYRKAVMTTIAWHFGPIGAMVKGERPFDKNLVARNADRIEALSKMPLEGFIAGTESGETRVKPEAFLEMDKFRGGMEKLQTESAKLAQAAKSGNLDQIRPQFGEVAKTCKGCHDNYREK